MRTLSFAHYSAADSTVIVRKHQNRRPKAAGLVSILLSPFGKSSSSGVDLIQHRGIPELPVTDM